MVHNSNKKQVLYSYADWKSHKNKLGYDDLMDEKGHHILTISVMDIALNDVLNESYLVEPIERPKKIFIQDKDNSWDIFLNTKWLTPALVQKSLSEFGNLVGKKFKFEPHTLPKNLKVRIERKHAEWDKDSKEALSPAETKKSEEFFKKWKKEMEEYKKTKVVKKISGKRLIQIITHKLKF